MDTKQRIGKVGKFMSDKLTNAIMIGCIAMLACLLAITFVYGGFHWLTNPSWVCGRMGIIIVGVSITVISILVGRK